jgi:ArsR family transcriptional regulator
MEKSNAVAALAALAQDNRLDVYRLLVQAGPDGLPAGQVAAALKLAPNTLTFHFDGSVEPASCRCGVTVAR